MACARVSRSPGLLTIIFNVLERVDLVEPALVCKAWNAVARDAIWRQVDESLELFSLIAPIDDTEGQQVRAHWLLYLSMVLMLKYLGVSAHTFISRLGPLSTNSAQGPVIDSDLAQFIAGHRSCPSTPCHAINLPLPMYSTPLGETCLVQS